MYEFTEGQVRLGIFIGLFLTMALMEFLSPRRVPKPVKTQRWITNWAIVLVDTAVVRVIFASAAVGVAYWAELNHIGLFNQFNAPDWIAFLVSFLVLDFAIWFGHVASHKLPILWKVHRMHHSDVDMDVTTAIRFHPIEIVLSMVWKSLVIILIGAPVASVLVFEIVLNGAAMFNHSNFKIPLYIDRFLRMFIVTPDMHRVHHSIIHNETDSNYGFNLAIWDRIFGTYIEQPKAGHDDMIIGLEEWQDDKPTKLIWSLKVPFLKEKS